MVLQMLSGQRFRDYSVIKFRDWEHICQRGYADRTWLFSILSFADGQPFYKTIAYLKRHIPITDVDPFVAMRDAVAIYFTGVTLPEDERPDFGNFIDPHIRLREILPSDSGLFVYTDSDQEGPWNVNDMVTPAKGCRTILLRCLREKGWPWLVMLSRTTARGAGVWSAGMARSRWVWHAARFPRFYKRFYVAWGAAWPWSTGRGAVSMRMSEGPRCG